MSGDRATPGRAGRRPVPGLPLLAAALLLLAGGTGTILERARQASGIGFSRARVPLGGFEPLAVNLLWARGDVALSEGRLSDAVAAITLVTELQPRVTAAWGFLSYILAWARSESSGDPEEQWRWVREGIRILSRGLALNPGNPELLWTMGRIYRYRLSWDPALRDLAERKLGRAPEELAVEWFRRLHRRAPSDVSRQEMAEAARRLGLLRERRGDRSGAVRSLEESLRFFRALAREPDAELARRRATEIQALLERLRGR